MAMKSIYRTSESGARLAQITQEIRERIEFPLIDHEVSTSFAQTHVVETGNPDGPPLIVMHGGGTNGIFALYFVQALLPHHRVFAVDTPGHPGASECVFIDPRGNDSGRWLQEVAEALSLEKANYLGISWGGYIVQRLAAVSPESISKVVFLVPGGIVNPPFFLMLRDFLLPRIFCRWTGSTSYLDRFFDKLFTDNDDPLIREYFESYFMDVRADMRPMKRSTPEEMRKFTAPKLILGADQDIFFPSAKLEERSAQVFPEPLDFRVIENSKHSPSMDEARLTALVNEISTFLLE